MEMLLSKNPMTGAVLKEIPKTAVADLPEYFRRAERAQKDWSKVSPKERAKKLIHLREILVRKAESLAQTIHQENGKPNFEAISSEILPALELLSYFADRGPSLLKDKEITIRNPMLKYRRSYLNYWPLGVVAVIAPWNYPFFLAFGDVVLAVLTGNAVVFKPSEYTSQIGGRIQEFFDEAGFPMDLVQTVYGDGTLGSALIEQKPAKIFFTGSVRTGKAIMAQASKHLIPVVLELGGKDAMIVLPDADLDYATSAALWGGFTNSGQVCASTERLLVHESMASAFVEMLKNKISQIPNRDLGAITMERQKDVYREQLAEAREKGATVFCGGNFRDNDARLEPTLVGGPNIEQTKIYNEETFGPVIAITEYKTISEAVQKANHSAYGLLASVISKDISLAESVAKQIEAGSVLVNEVAYTAGLPETPWGGLKESGFGRKHSDMGLYEFVNVRHINMPRAGFLTFKSLWWFPYSKFQGQMFHAWLGLYRASFWDRIKVVPHLIWCFVKMLKNEKRI